MTDRVWELDLATMSPSFPVPLTSVGTTARLIPIKLRENEEKPATSHLCSVELSSNLPAQRRGIHFSRWSEMLEAACEQEFTSAQHLVFWLANEVARCQRVEMSTARIEMHWPCDDTAPASGQRTKKVYRVRAQAHVDRSKVEILIGVVVPIFLACPCAQINLARSLSEPMAELGVSAIDFEAILDRIPLASHSQRGQVEVWLEDTRMDLDPREIIDVIEATASISHDLLKRSDEIVVVCEAHTHPRLCEDVVRDVAQALSERMDGRLPAQARITVRVTSQESIHSYDIVGELTATFGEINTK